MNLAYTTFALGQVTESFTQQITCTIKICDVTIAYGLPGHCPIRQQDDCPTDEGFDFTSVSLGDVVVSAISDEIPSASGIIVQIK